MDGSRHDRWSRHAGVRWNPLPLVIPAIKSMPRTPIRGGNLGEVWVVAMTLELSHQPGASIFITWCAGASRHDRFVRKHVPDSDPGCAYAAFERAVEPLHSAISSFRPPNSSFPRRRESRGEVRVVAMTLELSHQPMHPIFVPWCAGTSRHERLVRRHVPDSDPGWIPAPAGDHRRRRSSEYSPSTCNVLAFTPRERRPYAGKPIREGKGTRWYGRA